MAVFDYKAKLNNLIKMRLKHDFILLEMKIDGVSFQDIKDYDDHHSKICNFLFKELHNLGFLESTNGDS